MIIVDLLLTGVELPSFAGDFGDRHHRLVDMEGWDCQDQPCRHIFSRLLEVDCVLLNVDAHEHLCVNKWIVELYADVPMVTLFIHENLEQLFSEDVR